MNPSILVSWGELIDKVTILEIKAQWLTSETARANVRHELGALAPIASGAERMHPEIAKLKAELKRVNETLWQIEDDIREKEAEKSFDADFIALARAVYHNNDTRGRLKQKINTLLQSDITEEKQYSTY
jgi:predicted ribosome-associated RNA-binding protein Tma20